MRGRDIVYLWLAGSEDIRGIYGWGRLEGRPKLGGGNPIVDVRVEVVLTSPLPTVERHAA